MSSHPHCSRLATSRARSACSASRARPRCCWPIGPSSPTAPTPWSNRPLCSGIAPHSLGCRYSRSSLSYCSATRDALAGDRRAMEERLRWMEALDGIPPDNRRAAGGDPGDGGAGGARPAGRQDVAGRVGAAARSSTLRRHRCATSVVAGDRGAVDGPDEKARAVVRGRPAMLRRSTLGALRYADAIVAGREGRDGRGRAGVRGRERAARADGSGGGGFCGCSPWRRQSRMAGATRSRCSGPT